MTSTRIPVVKSPTDIDWKQPLHEQLWPELEGHPTHGKPNSDFKLLRKQVPVLTEEQFNKIYPSREHSTITVVNRKAHAWHYVDQRSNYMDSKWHPMVQHPRAADGECNLDQRLTRCSKVPVLATDSPGQLPGLHSKVADLSPTGR